MAEYNARWAEFEKSLEIVQQKEKIELKLENLPLLSRYSDYKDSLLKYMDWRDKALNNALPILKYTSTSITGEEQKAKWEDYFTLRGSKALQMILSYIPDDDKTPKLRLFAQAMAMQESNFFEKLSTVPLAWFQGKVQEYTQDFLTQKASLEVKWKELGDKDKTVDAKVKNTTTQVLDVFREVVQDLAEQERHGEKLAHSFVEGLRRIPGVPSIAYLAEIMAHSLSIAQSCQASLDTLANLFMSIYKSQETIVIMFTQTRSGVYTFLEVTNLDKVQTQFDESNKKSLGIAKQCKTKGQRDDAIKFIERAIPSVKNIFEEFKKQYGLFVTQNQGKFVGPVSDKTTDEILERQDMASEMQKIESFNIQQKLKDIHRNAEGDWKVDLDGVTDEQKIALKEYWRKELEKFGRGVIKAADGPALSRLKEGYGYRWNNLASRMKSSKGGLQ